MVENKSLMVLWVMVAVSTSVMAVELDVDLSTDFLSRYVWRGQDGGQTTVAQPSATISKDGYSFNVWGNMPLSDIDSSDGSAAGRSFTFTEVDYTLDYTGDVPGSDILDFSAGYIMYHFPSTTGMTAGAGTGVTGNPASFQELYAGLAVDTLLNPSVTIYRGIQFNPAARSNGWYINAGVDHCVALPEDMALDLSASIGWGDSNYNNSFWTGGTPGEGLNDLVVGASLPIDIAGITLVPQVSYITLVESQVRRDNALGGNSDFWVAGVGASKAF